MKARFLIRLYIVRNGKRVSEFSRDWTKAELADYLLDRMKCGYDAIVSVYDFNRKVYLTAVSTNVNRWHELHRIGNGDSDFHAEIIEALDEKMPDWQITNPRS